MPGVVVDDEHVAPGAALALAAQHADAVEVLDRAGDRGRAHPEDLADLGGGHPAVVVDQDRGEDPGRETGQTCGREGGAEPLHEDGTLLRGRHSS